MTVADKESADPNSATSSAAPTKRAPLRERMLKGGVWALGGLGARNTLRLVSNLAMTRLLAPEAFGLMAVAAAANFWLTMLSDLGLNSSVMRAKKATDPAFFSTIWWTQFGRNVLIAVCLGALALALVPMREDGMLKEGTVYADPMLPIFVAGVALNVLIKSVGAMRGALYQRDLNMGPLIRIDLSTQAIGIASMVTLAALGAGPYALIGGMLISQICSSAASHIFLKGPPIQFLFDRGHFKEIFNYGKWILVSSLFGAMANRGDQLIFGWLLGINAFSLYAIATIWITAAAGVVRMIIRKITFPVFAEVHRERPQDIARVYEKMRLGVELAALGLFFGALLTADFGVSLLYKDEYAGMAHYIKLLSVAFLLLPNSMLHVVILSAGDSRRFMLATILHGSALIIGVPLVYNGFGVDAAIVYGAMTPIAAMPYNWRAAKKFMKVDLRREFAQMAIAGLAAVFVLSIA